MDTKIPGNIAFFSLSHLPFPLLSFPLLPTVSSSSKSKELNGLEQWLQG